MKRNALILLASALALGACGGHKPADTTPTGSTLPAGNDATAYTGVMVPPEKMDEVQRDLKRKSMIVSQCLAEAADAGRLKKPINGNVALEIVISPAGKASSVHVIKSDFDDKGVTDCVIGHVTDIQFPTLPKSYETSYTYAMEAN